MAAPHAGGSGGVPAVAADGIDAGRKLAQRLGARGRVVPTGDAAYPAVVVGDEGAQLVVAASGTLRPLPLPIAARDVAAAVIDGGNLFLGTSGRHRLCLLVDLAPADLPAAGGAGTAPAELGRIQLTGNGGRIMAGPIIETLAATAREHGSRPALAKRNGEWRSAAGRARHRGAADGARLPRPGPATRQGVAIIDKPAGGFTPTWRRSRQAVSPPASTPRSPEQMRAVADHCPGGDAVVENRATWRPSSRCAAAAHLRSIVRWKASRTRTTMRSVVVRDWRQRLTRPTSTRSAAQREDDLCA